MGRPSDDSGCAVQVRQRNRTGCGKPVTAQFIELGHPVRSAMRLLIRSMTEGGVGCARSETAETTRIPSVRPPMQYE